MDLRHDDDGFGEPVRPEGEAFSRPGVRPLGRCRAAVRGGDDERVPGGVRRGVGVAAGVLLLPLAACVAAPVAPEQPVRGGNVAATADAGVESGVAEGTTPLEAAAAVIEALESPRTLRPLVAAEGLLVYDLHACAPNRLPPTRLTPDGLDGRFRVDTCHDDGPGEAPGEGAADGVTWRWGDYLAALRENPALTDTDAVLLDERRGPGLDTGTRHRVEERFGEGYRIVSYRFRGGEAQAGRDRSEVGFVFEEHDGRYRLLALYEDSFSAY